MFAELERAESCVLQQKAKQQSEGGYNKVSRERFSRSEKEDGFSFYVSCFVLNIVKTGDEYKDIERDWRGWGVGQEIKEETEIIFKTDSLIARDDVSSF